MDEQAAVAQAAGDCAARNPGAARPFATEQALPVVQGYVPQQVSLDPAGYFVIHLDRVRRLLILEHYRTDGVLDAVIEGEEAAELCFPAIEKGLVSQLDHAAYLGRELAPAEQALLTEEHFVQDAAPGENEMSDPSCRCGE